jgi:hypothetical protein
MHSLFAGTVSSGWHIGGSRKYNHRVTERTEATNDIPRRKCLFKYWYRVILRLCELCGSVVGNRSFLIKLTYRRRKYLFSFQVLEIG